MKSKLLKYLSGILMLSIIQPAIAQNEGPYNIELEYDLPLVAIGLGGLTYGYYKIGQKSSADSAEVLALDEDDIIGFNQGAIHEHNSKWNKRSNYFFYPAFGYPFLLLIDKEIRKDAATVGLLYLEAMSLVGGSYAMTAGHVDKFRPYSYHPDTDFGKRGAAGSQLSFFGGHPAIVAASTFFTAKVYGDYHPESNFKYALYGVATGATLATGYYRWRGGYHFTTDIIIGVAVGAAGGILVPELHKRKDVTEPSLGIRPFSGEYHGFKISYKF